MSKCLARLWKEEDGVLAFEWVLLVTLLVIGIVSGVAAARDGIVDELGDVAEAMLAVDQSYSIDYTLDVRVHELTTQPSGGSDSQFIDARSYIDCDRITAAAGIPTQGPVDDGDA